MSLEMRAVSAAAARRFLVARHLLAPPRSLAPEPASVMRVIGRLGSLQFDPIDVAGRNHDLTLLARIAGYRRAWTDELLYRDRVLYETYNKMLSIVPTAELPWYRITWDQAHDAHRGGAFDDHAPLVEELLARIRAGGPMSSTDVEPRASIDWYWRPTNQVRALLEALAEAGLLAIARREVNRRVYDLTERLFPPELLGCRVPSGEQLRHKLLSRYRGNGLLAATGDSTLWMGLGKAPERRRLHDELLEAGAITPLAVEGLRAPRFALTEELGMLDAAEVEVAADAASGNGTGGRPGGHAPRVTFLAPLDPLAWDRDLLEQLWGFEYRWEVYVPAPKRRWGYYVLPVLYGDRFIGRIELRAGRSTARPRAGRPIPGPRAGRSTATLRVLGLWWEPGFHPFDPSLDDFVGAFADALWAHAAFVDATRIGLLTTGPQRAFARAVRERSPSSRDVVPMR